MSHSILKPFVLLLTLIIIAPVSGQQVHSYKLVPRTVYEKRPVKAIRWIDETVMEKQTVTSYKQVWHTETRERHKTEYKPIRKTSEREERTVVQKPVVETRFRKQEKRTTTYETVTEMRDETYTVRKPVIETQMRDETITVRRPVTEELIEVQRTTSFKPTWNNTTNYVPQNAVVQQLGVVTDSSRRPRIRRIDSGYYTDPATGQSVYRRRGLHWVQPTEVVATASTVPTLVPQTTAELSYTPEVTETRKPIQVTRYVEQTETRRVPVETRRMVEQVETRKVPVTVRIPKTTVTVEEIPYTETVYRDEVIVKKVPYTETTYEKVETTEPYTVQVPSWVEETKEVEVPRQIRKRVEYELMSDIPRTVMYRIPLDDCGNELGPGVRVELNSESVSPNYSSQSGTTTAWRIPSTVPATSTDSSNETSKSVLETDFKAKSEDGYKGELKLGAAKTLDETSSRESSIVVPETKPGVPNSELGRIQRADDGQATDGDAEAASNLAPAQPPEIVPSGSGDENAAERPPVPRDKADDAGSSDDSDLTAV